MINALQSATFKNVKSCKCYKFVISNVINLPKNRISGGKSANVV